MLDKCINRELTITIKGEQNNLVLTLPIYGVMTKTPTLTTSDTPPTNADITVSQTGELISTCFYDVFEEVASD